MAFLNPPDDQIRHLLTSARTIGVVGASGNPLKPSHRICAYLQAAGYRVIPVNPNETEVLGEPAYATLDEVPDPIDIVDVFRRPEHTPEIADQAVAAGAGALWLQLGISNQQAAERASAGGLAVVMDRCIAVVHRQLRIGPAGS